MNYSTVKELFQKNLDSKVVTRINNKIKNFNKNSIYNLSYDHTNSTITCSIP